MKHTLNKFAQFLLYFLGALSLSAAFLGRKLSFLLLGAGLFILATYLKRKQ